MSNDEAFPGDEAERFALRYRCEHCAHFARTREACSMGYPTLGLVGPIVTPAVICKYWELGEDS
jgi:hypothetical protein